MERTVINILKHSQHQEFEYTILVGNYEEEFGRQQLASIGVKFEALQYYGTYHFATILKKFNEYLKLHKYDLVHCHINNSIGLIFTYVARKQGIKAVVAHTHNNSFGSGKLLLKRLLRVLALLLFRKIPDLFFSCSEEAEQWTFGKKTKSMNHYIVYNGVEYENFCFSKENRKKLRRVYNIEDKYVIGHIGHFNYQKNQEFLIRIVPQIAKEIPNIHLFLIGAGETKEKIKTLVSELHCSNQVTIIEPIDNVNEFYSIFDLFVLPSRFEGFGIVAVEAQFNGLHVICSDKVPEVIDVSGNVEFCSVEDIMSEAKWSKIIINQSKKIEDRAFECDTMKFDNRKITQIIEDAYTEVFRESRTKK